MTIRYILFLAIFLVVMMMVTVPFISAQTATTLFVDPSLDPDVAHADGNNCTRAAFPCATFSRAASQVVNDAITYNIVVTWSSITRTVYDASAASAPAAAPFSAVSWSRVGLSAQRGLPVDPSFSDEEHKAFAHAEVSIVVHMQWNCHQNSSDYAYVRPRPYAWTSWKADPLLSSQSIIWPSTIYSGTENDIGFNSSSEASQVPSEERVLVLFHVSQACKARRDAYLKTLTFGITNHFYFYGMLTLSRAQFSYLGFSDVSSSVPVTYSTSTWQLAGIALHYPSPSSGAYSVTISNAFFRNSQAAITSIYNASPSGLRIGVNIIKSVSYNNTRGVYLNGQVYQPVSVDGLQVTLNSQNGLYLNLDFSVISEGQPGVVIKNSLFSNNTGKTAVQFGNYIEKCTSGEPQSPLFQNTVFLDNNFTEVALDFRFTNCGSGQGRFDPIVQGCTFKRNFGGGIAVDDIESLQIMDSVFEENTVMEYDTAAFVPKGGGAIRAENTNSLEIDRCHFRHNVAHYGGSILLTGQARGRITECIFEDDVALSGNGGSIAGYSPDPVVTDTKFFRSSAPNGRGGCLYQNSETNDDYLVFSKNEFDSCSSGISGGCMELQSVRAVFLLNSTFSGCSTKGSGGALALDQTHVVSQDSTFLRNSAVARGGLVATRGYSSFIMQSTEVYGATAQAGGVADLSGSGVFIAVNTSISGATASIGALAIVSSSSALPWRTVDPSASIANRMFSIFMGPSNYPLNPQAFASLNLFQNRYILFYNVKIRDTFAENTGDLFVCAEPSSACPDWSQLLGGHGQLDYSEPSDASKHAASPASTLWSSSDPRNIKLVQVNLMSLDMMNKSIAVHSQKSGRFEVMPGQTFELLAAVLDVYGTTLSSYNQFTVDLTAKSIFGISVVQPQSAQIDAGVVAFPAVRALGTIGSVFNVSLSFTTPFLQNPVILNIPFEIVQCELGYAFTGEACSRCNGPEFYSITPGATLCSNCPTNAYCNGPIIESLDGYFMVVKNGTATSSAKYSDAAPAAPAVSILACPNAFCKKGNKCTDNRDGLLCGSCAKGYSDWNGTCLRCKEESSAGGIIFWLFYLAVMWLFQHISAQSAKSGAMKILFFYTQTFLLAIGPVASRLLLWSKALFEFQIVVPGASSPSGDLDQIQCPFQRDSYGKMLTDLFQPIAFIVVLVMAFCLFGTARGVMLLVLRIRSRSSSPAAEKTVDSNNVQSPSGEPGAVAAVELQEIGAPPAACAAPDTKDAKEPETRLQAIIQIVIKQLKKKLFKMFFGISTWVRSLLQMLILSFQMIGVAGFFFFSCKQIGDNYVSVRAADVVCDSPIYAQYRGLFIAASIYACLLPLVFWVVLIILRLTHKLENKEAQRFLGAIYLNYKQRYWWWYEPYALCRRLAIIIVVTFMSSNPAAMYPVLLFLLLIFQIVQFTLRPYVHWTENIAEEVSLASLILVVALNSTEGFGSSDASAGISLALFIVTIVFIVVAYLCNHWIVQIVAKAVEKTGKQVQRQATRKFSRLNSTKDSFAFSPHSSHIDEDAMSQDASYQDGGSIGTATEGKQTAEQQQKEISK